MSVRDQNSTSLLASQQGQAVVEYILILVVIVAIVLGGLYQVNTAFKVWAENYFGSYLSCLLETGELPALGGSVNTAGQICNQLYEPYSFDKGRPLIASSGGGSSGSSSSGSSSKTQQSSSSSDSNPNNKRGVSESSGGSSGSSQVNASSRFNAGRFGSNQISNGSTSKRIVTDSYTGSTDGSIPGSFLNSSGNGRIRMKLSDDNMKYWTDEEKKRQPIKSADGVRKTEDQMQERARKKAMPFRAPAAEKPKEDSAMTFGSFLRYLVIAAIIIALVLVIGGQLMQISKSSGGD